MEGAAVLATAILRLRLYPGVSAVVLVDERTRGAATGLSLPSRRSEARVALGAIVGFAVDATAILHRT